MAKIKALFTAVLFFALASAAAGADVFDGSRPLLCAATVALSCTWEGECTRGPAEGVNLPPFLRLDFQSASASASGTLPDGTEKKVGISKWEVHEEALILQGLGQQSRGWTLLVDRHDGKMALTISGPGEGFAVFGVCTNP